ncbi:trafficking protein particle complex subunit 12 [Tribolium castaneum]|uniref:Trafficking protein particle complex subunit 12-like Protein n=1 Tax=Tribolium castaneum TaxID=7070 RepID=D6WPG0_TRICA|nr:PREDICTED: trafficking protein particle complex subunit 12 [Tribolium castaneum]EFA06807.1 Trafficking protein particle complex subunit 12-like Protein [Tribolium castaneum]|eukprot:XP_973508.1 PREDICTED: trafficking protein particle complex subunit 12 [Tribolium castaneum]
MSESVPPSLSQYFGEKTDDKVKTIDLSEELNEASTKITDLKLDDNLPSAKKNEPEVCRIFAETPPQAKDQTTSFFDLIGNNHSVTSNGLISNLDITPNNDDGFCPRVALGSEADRRRDAWIPSERTRQCLIACATAAPGTYFPDRELLTMPGVLLEEDLGDNIGEAVTLCLGEAEAAQRSILSESDVTQDERGLRELVQAGSYRAAINLTARLLTIYGQGRGRAGHPSKHSPHSLQLWFTRIALLVKIKAFAVAQSEAAPFGQLDKPDVFYQFYPEMYGGRPGSIASFSFRLLLSELPMHCGKPKDSLTKLYSMKSTIKQMLDNLKQGLSEDGSPIEISESDRTDSIRLWTGRETRVMHSIVNCALALKDYELAMVMMEELCHRDGTARHMLYSALGRLRLQVGDVAGAETCFDEARALRGNTTDLREYVDRGLLAVAQNSFDEAYVCFQQASLLDPTNVMILNNMGVCLLYGGHLKEAIKVLESAIESNPVHALHESLLLNLCTLYDMESSKGRMKKFALLRQISRYQADAPTTILEKLYG